MKRRSFVRVLPPPIQLADWDAVNAKSEEKEKRDEGQKHLFE